MKTDRLKESPSMDMNSQVFTIESELKKSFHPNGFFSLLKSFFDLIDSQDPHLFHYEIARKTLGLLDESFLANENAIDRLAREFLNHCHQLKNQFIQINTSLHLIEEELFVWDHLYLKLLLGLGSTGKSETEQLTPKLKRFCKENSYAFWTQFSDQKETHIFHSPAFLILAAILWKERIKKWVSFEARQLPAVSSASYQPLRRFLSAQMKAQTNQQLLQIIHEENLIGKIHIPTVPAHLMPFIFRGAPKLNSVYGHRLFRFEVQEPFRQMVAGNADYRVIKLDGGFTELAERLKLKGKKAITVLKEILYAQAHIEFCCQNFSGNFIQLSKCLSPHVGKEIGLLITVGTLLLPYQTFEDVRKGHCGLLIPLVHDPPLVGANQYHAGQYALQMDIMAELSRNSIELVQHGSVKIPMERWQELAQQSSLPSSLLTLIHDRWTQDGDDAAQFLEQVSKDRYTLGKAYNKELQFLKAQGKMRIRRSEAGKKSAEKRHVNK